MANKTFRVNEKALGAFTALFYLGSWTAFLYDHFPAAH